MKDIELEPGEVICKECNGSGKKDEENTDIVFKIFNQCKKCHGKGKLDWVENVVGKEKDHSNELLESMQELLTGQPLINETLKRSMLNDLLGYTDEKS